jgi:hypothetical protein
MSIIDINNQEEEVITEIRWSTSASEGDNNYNLIRDKSSVTLRQEGLDEIAAGDCNLCENASEAEALIKALQKAIDLGWFNR